jgi:hypothetical protein
MSRRKLQSRPSGDEFSNRQTLADIYTSRPMFVVLGMHKSGTTMVSATLHASGINMGDVDCSLDYEAGNKFERSSFREINHLLLGSLGVPSRKVRAPLHLRKRRLCRKTARRLIAKLEAVHGDSWGFKDPRTSFTINFWDGVLPRPHYIFVYRDVRETVLHYSRFVAHRPPLARALTVYQALGTWCSANSACAKFLARTGHPFIVFRYSDLLSQKSELQRLASFVGRRLEDTRDPHLRSAKDVMTNPWGLVMNFLYARRIQRVTQAMDDLLQLSRRHDCS